MDGRRFDALTRALQTTRSRRQTLAGLCIGLLGLLTWLPRGEEAAAKKRRGKRKKKKKTSPPPASPQNPCPHALCHGTCIDTQTSPQHCGGCDVACGTNETCVGGHCFSASGCGPTQINCGGGLCIPNHEHACCSQDDCGGLGNDLVCDTGLKRCVCGDFKAGWGICRRFSNGTGICGVCCPGATLTHPCQGDLVCRDHTSSGRAGCGCPEERPDQCGAPVDHLCSLDLDTDPHRCGLPCLDCTTTKPGSTCCNGVCIRGAAPGSTDGTQQPCGPGCTSCATGTICCNRGPGTPGVCVPNAFGGRCPLQSEWE